MLLERLLGRKFVRFMMIGGKMLLIFMPKRDGINPTPIVGLDVANLGRLADERKGVNSSSGYAPVEVPAENVGTLTPGAEKLSGGDVGMI
jgi:hypothetical protein